MLAAVLRFPVMRRNCIFYLGRDIKYPFVVYFVQTCNIRLAGPGVDKNAFLNITNLYKGEDVTFRITNKQWLVNNNWILDSEKNKAIYIKDFELFLPTVSEESVTYISRVKATGKRRSSLSSR